MSSNASENESKTGNDLAVTADTEVGQATTITKSPTWTRYVPGPSPGFLYTGLSPRLSSMGVVLCGGMIFLLSGYNVALMGSVSSVPGYLHVVGLDDGSQNTQLLIGTVNAIYWVGVAIGAMGVGWFSDIVGRRRALVTCLIFAAITIPIFAALQNFGWAIAMRLMNGFAIGATDSVGLNWTAETADHKHRGRAICIELMFAPTAASIAYFMVYGLQLYHTSQLAWRLPLAFQMVFVAMIFAIVWFLPESPRWLIRAGYVDDARRVLTILRKETDELEASAAVERDINSISEALRDEETHNLSTSYWRMFTMKDHMHTRRRSWSALFVQFSTQIMVGVGFVSGYGILLFQTGGFDQELATLLSGGAILTQAVFGAVGALVADKMGRRIAMYGGASVGSVLLLLIGVCGYFVARYADDEVERARPFGTAIITLVYLFCALFGVTWLWVPFTYPSEIFPAQSRARGSSIGVAGFAASCFVTNMISPYLFSAIGYASLFLICGLSLTTAIVCYFFMPETAGKTLEEIDHIFD